MLLTFYDRVEEGNKLPVKNVIQQLSSDMKNDLLAEQVDGRNFAFSARQALSIRVSKLFRAGRITSCIRR